MFYNLRLKLTLINATVIFLFFLLLISGTYYFSHVEITRHSELLAQKILHEVQSGLISDLPVHPEVHHKLAPPKGSPLPSPLSPPPPPPFASFFFVKVSGTGNIILQSSYQPLASETLNTLIKSALQNERLQGMTTVESSEYSFLKSSTNTLDENIIVFKDYTQENNMRDIQLTALIITGIICLILSLFGSFFMANRALAPIQAAWQQQKDFLSDASHELRTPLAVLQTNLDIVLGNKTESVTSQIHWLQNMQEEVTQMTTLVDSLLFLARADSHQQIINKQPFSFTATAARTLLPFRPVAAEKEISLNILSDKPISYIGDEVRIKQVITILLDNAIRHTAAGGKIVLETSEAGTSIFLVVTDSGEGIPAEVLDKIFNRFYQVDNARANGGAGLGLAIAKWIIEAHSGTICVTSTPEIGTTFTIELPKG
jgi:signal transduction histidine kinase